MRVRTDADPNQMADLDDAIQLAYSQTFAVVDGHVDDVTFLEFKAAESFIIDSA